MSSAPSSPANEPVPFGDVLWTELRALRPDEASGERGAGAAPALPETYRRVGALNGKEPLAALCLSGGGIRSATFNLGVLQALARLGVLGRFDYLSSVSGGGYIASWLRTWMARDGSAAVIETLGNTARARGEQAANRGAPPVDPLTPEPPTIDHLREYSNYLTPRLGLMSADTWTAAAMILRNMLLNWLVLVPLLAAFVTAPQVMLLLLQSSREGWRDALFGLSLLAAVVAGVGTHVLHRSRRRGLKPSWYLLFSVSPIVLSCVLMAVAVVCVRPAGASVDSTTTWAVAALWCIGAPVAGWLAAVVARRAPAGALPPAWAEFFGLVGSGAVATVILYAIARGWLPYLRERLALHTVLAVPILLAVYLLARALFVALGSVGEGRKRRGLPGPEAAGTPIASPEDAAREWWARLSGWILAVAAAWLVVSAVVVLGGWAFESFSGWLPHATAGVGGLSGLVASLLASSGRGPASSETRPTTASKVKEVGVAMAAPLFVLSLVVLLSAGTAALGRLVVGADVLRFTSPFAPGDPRLSSIAALVFLVVPGGLVAFGFLAGALVNVNRFSLHGFYRNRLIRAYLGASNTSRREDPFTGFDPGDNMKLHELWRDGGVAEEKRATRPLPVICVALNLTKGAKLAWQQRKAESFSMTPFFCGNFLLGYRRSDEYGGSDGVSVGTAVTISGAAANPNMGYHSSPLLAFMMTLFNARLGAWLGNTNVHGNHTYGCSGPRQAVVPLVSELFGSADDTSAYVNLSDGGHFDNLGIYEMVLRRCRFILVSDAGQDPSCSFEDLGNAIRKVRIDFGVPVEFERKIHILPRSASGVGGYCAVAKVRYSDVDDTPRERDGDLIYIKPALDCGGDTPDPYDVYSYRVSSSEFPHEPTADQWFSEAQFESYRALGFHLVKLIGTGAPIADLPGLKQAFETYLDKGIARELQAASARAVLGAASSPSCP